MVFQDALPIHDKIADLIPEVPELPTDTPLVSIFFLNKGWSILGFRIRDYNTYRKPPTVELQ